MKISARNQIKGTVKKIEIGAVNCEVMVEIAPGIEITSLITKTSLENLDIKYGKEVYVVVKASNVLLGIDH